MVKKIAIASLSRGILGEPFIKHELDIGLKRLESYGIQVQTTPSALKGLEYVAKHPEERAKDLLNALKDKSIDMILCAIGGDDTYRLLPYLFENDELKNAVQENKKIFLGFSDSTMNHFMLHKVGLNTFYGQSFLADVCELENEMLPYSKKFLEELLNTGKIDEITPSDVWYKARESYEPSQIGVKRPCFPNKGFELLQGKPTFSGKILGGCIETIFDMFDGTRYADSPSLCQKYGLFPSVEEWKGKILLLESSEEQTKPDLYKKMISTLKQTGIFSVISGVLVGKPFDEVYYDDYKKILVQEIANPNLPILYNVNIGHAAPKCIIPFGVEAQVDFNQQKIKFKN
ncbi:S66 family peptidase [Treponema zioleckii]|uniref:S66 family peptidase n=1 Tax=Treponema zioleckii TaxID=331680 RepID=UPI00168BC05B|nr:S66 peptidase family protein [Treponema zioleckii]